MTKQITENRYPKKTSTPLVCDDGFDAINYKEWKQKHDGTEIKTNIRSAIKTNIRSAIERLPDTFIGVLITSGWFMFVQEIPNTGFVIFTAVWLVLVVAYLTITDKSEQ